MLLRRSRSPRTSAPRRGTGEAGVTLVELLIASAILLVVLVVVFDSFDSVSKSQAYQADRSNNLDKMRTTLERMTKELRQATGIDSSSTPSRLQYTTYIGGVLTDVVYVADGTTKRLTRQVGTGTPFPVLTNLAPDVTGGSTISMFSYTSADEVDATTAGPDTQWVKIDIRLIPSRSPDTILELESEVNLRNRTTALTG